MSTLGDMQSRIYREIHQTLSVDVRNAILDSVKFYQDKRFWFNEATTSFNTSITTVYSLYSAMPKVINVDSIKTAGNKILRQAGWNELDRFEHYGTVTGTPTEYAVHHEMLRLYPTPTATSSVTCIYHKQITLSASNSASAVWTNEASNLIRHRAKAVLYASVLLDSAQAEIEHLMEKSEFETLANRSIALTQRNK